MQKEKPPEHKRPSIPRSQVVFRRLFSDSVDSGYQFNRESYDGVARHQLFPADKLLEGLHQAAPKETTALLEKLEPEGANGKKIQRAGIPPATAEFRKLYMAAAEDASRTFDPGRYDGYLISNVFPADKLLERLREKAPDETKTLLAALDKAEVKPLDTRTPTNLPTRKNIAGK